MRRRKRFIALAALILAVLGITRTELFIRWKVDPQLRADQATLKKHLSLYLDDVNYVQSRKIFVSQKQGARDAGSYLNSMLVWAPLPSALTTNSNLSKTPLVPTASRERLLRLESKWMHHFSILGEMPTDLSLFNRLKDFDYWNIEKSSPIAQLVDRNEFVEPAQLPMPDTLDLTVLSKMRLMKAVTDSDPAEALVQVRQLGRLLLTTENTQLMAAGLEILDDERLAYLYLAAHGKVLAAQWQPIDPNALRRARRALYATRGYLHVWTPPAILKEVFEGTQEPIGFCAAVNDAVPVEYSLRPYLESHWPFERDYAAGFVAIDRLVKRARASCRLTYVGLLLDKSNFPAKLPGPPLLNRLPYWRKLFALRSSVSNFSGFDLYNRLLLATSGEPKQEISADDSTVSDDSSSEDGAPEDGLFKDETHDAGHDTGHDTGHATEKDSGSPAKNSNIQSQGFSNRQVGEASRK